MNRLLLFFLIAAAPPLFSAPPPETEQQEIQRLIENIPSYTAFSHLAQTVLDKTGDAESVAFARSEIAKAQESIPKLRKFLTVGSNILDYPGLIAHGYLLYDSIGTNGKYHLRISASMGGKEGVALPWEFLIRFNDRGIITAVEDMVYKK